MNKRIERLYRNALDQRYGVVVDHSGRDRAMQFVAELNQLFAEQVISEVFTEIAARIGDRVDVDRLQQDITEQFKQPPQPVVLNIGLDFTNTDVSKYV